MKLFIYVFFLIPQLLFSADSRSSLEEENPSVFHHVNVITGDLQLSFEDANISSPHPCSIRRSYTSSGALEKDKRGSDLLLKDIQKGFRIQGGWSLFSHSSLLIQPSARKEECKAYVSDKAGNTVTFVYSHRVNKEKICLKPQKSSAKSYDKLGSRFDVGQQELHLNIYKGEAKLYLPDGARWSYVGKTMKLDRLPSLAYYRLETEKLPSGYQIQYTYDKENRLIRIDSKSPSDKWSFAALEIELEKTKSPYRFHIRSSDDRTFHYRFLRHKERDYLCEVQRDGRTETIEYAESRSGLGARASIFSVNGHKQLQIHYYKPETEKEEKYWKENPDKTPSHIDKVRMIEGPYGMNGEMIPIGYFCYAPGYTDVRDAQHILTRYHHTDNHLTWIEYFDAQDRLSSQTKFFWEDGKLIAKAELTPEGKALFSKTFYYDNFGNVIEEVLWGNLSGEREEPFAIEANGTLPSAETFRRKYQYTADKQLLLLEEEEGGFTYRYQYAPDTDLLTAKFTCHQGEILVREFYFYNDERLVVAEVVDDGNSTNPHDWSRMTERKTIRYELDICTGLPIAQNEYYLDLSSGLEILLKRTLFGYSSQRRIIEEVVFDGTKTHRYTLRTEYDSEGRVLSKTNPLGEKSTYSYDALGYLHEIQEAGALKKILHHDTVGRLTSSEEIDTSGNTKVSYFTYDTKGRLLSEINPEGHQTSHTFDAFGQCTKTRYAPVKDSSSTLYTPEITYTYDSRGNLASTTDPRGITTKTWYTFFNKPYRILEDGLETFHRYTPSGLLIQTTHPDGTEEHYSYDPFHRMTSKKVFSVDHKLLAEESWVYNAFHLLSHIDSRGLETKYTYDGAGRLILESALDREKRYHYDELGFLERTQVGGLIAVEIHDVAGRVIEQWTEDLQGNTENKMRFVYDENHKKTQVFRQTSVGEVTDFITYDSSGRITSHIDPLQEKTQYIYLDNLMGESGEKLQQKITIDPLGVSTLETFDALGHIVSLEKKDRSNQTISLQSWSYDRSGNKVKQLTTIYEETTPTKTHLIEWEYDMSNRLIRETEQGKKSTTFSYDKIQRLFHKTLPNGITLSTQCDGLDRLIAEWSSDGTIHYLYEYQGPDPIRVQDLIHGSYLERSYNLFGELTAETTPTHHRYTWDYDSRGRCSLFTLPDLSSIAYQYSDLHLTHIQRKNAEGQLLYEHIYEAFDSNGHVSSELQPFNLGHILSKRDLMERPTQATSSFHTATLSYGTASLVLESAHTFTDKKTYEYDPLRQLQKENSTSYHFNSLGNSSLFTVNDFNQVVSTPDSQWIYDLRGYPTKKEEPLSSTEYTFDALGRLTDLKVSSKEQIHFTYDAFSRLLSKETSLGREDYIYDNDYEIGTCTPQGEILTLKVLGLAIQGDLGAAISIELNYQNYIPLHDLQGHIIALLSSQGEVIESYSFDAFGQETSDSTFLNPWRFCSKRQEQGLIFFGLRFYDPSLKRWLSPDPEGFAESPNLYLYLLNSPTNRLDLFGLHSELLSDRVHLDIPMADVARFACSKPKIKIYRGSIDGTPVDWVFHCGYLHRCQFTPEEEAAGKFNIFDHFHELVPNTGSEIHLVSFQNGIQTELKGKGSFYKMCKAITKLLPEHTLFIGLHNPPGKSFKEDFLRLNQELDGKETRIVSLSRQFFAAASTLLYNVNPKALWLHLAHSEGSVIFQRSIEGMTEEQRETIQKNIYCLTFGPVHPISDLDTYDAKNIYAEEDWIAQGYARKSYKNGDEYDIRIRKSTTPLKDWSMYLADHAFLGKSYQDSLKEKISFLRKRKEFYDGQKR